MKYLLRIGCLATLLIFALSSCAPADPPLNRWIHIDGKPRLILGLYEQITDDKLLADMAESGFNLVNTAHDSARLDQVHRHGMKAWVNLGGTLALPVPADDTGQAAALAKRVDQLKDHPAMLVWEAPDEPLWTHWWSRYGDIWKQHAEMDVIIVGAGETLKPQLQALKDSSEARHGRGLFAEADDLREEFWKLVGKPVPGPDRRFSSAVRRAAEQGDALTRGFALVKKIDPEGIRWINHAPRNSVQSLRHFNREVDMAGCDIYPVPVYQSGHSDLVNQSLSSVGAYTRRMADGAPGKSVAMVLQGFAWKDINQIKKDDHRPTFAETRFMAYDAILHGAAAIMWYGTAHIPKDSDLWRDILRTARELRRLEPALVAPPWPDPPRCIADEIPDSHDGPGPALLLRKVEDDFVILAVNETRYGLSFHVSKLPRALEGRVLHRLGTDETHTVSEGSFSDGIAAFDVHVYSTSRRFE